jgi:two-component system C4-dicarboxylate transport sensor histidine kinase DctB
VASPSAQGGIAADPLARNAASSAVSAHRRFARAAIGIYLCAAALTVGLLVAALLTDLSHERSTMRRMLLGETKLRAQYFSWYLGLLESELRRLSLRSEVNLLDRDMEPERSLLELSHSKSTFFNVGVAIIGSDGIVAWSEPRTFLPPGQSLASSAWFQVVRSSGAVHIEAEQPERESDALVYVASPIVRSGRFGGVLLGAIDLAANTALAPSALADLKIQTVLATRTGAVVYPAKPPPFAAEPVWRDLFRGNGTIDSFSRETRLDNRSMVTAAAAVTGADLYLLSLVDEGRLFGPARARLYERLAVGFIVTTIPFFFLVRALQRSLESFRQSEEQRNREEQLRLVGEAVNVIAHEVTNSLNGLRVGVDLMVPERGRTDERKKALTLHALRSELQRLTDFTTELLIFSKGITPRPTRLEIGEFVDKVIEVTRERAAEQGVALAIEHQGRPCAVRADPRLLHVVLINLVGNALDAVAMSNDHHPQIAVRLSEGRSTVEIRVSDNGPGVSQSMRHALFEPFVSGKPNGTGIGLALSQKIARAHGGELALEGNGPGATFLLTLPKEDP